MSLPEDAAHLPPGMAGEETEQEPCVVWGVRPGGWRVLAAPRAPTLGFQDSVRGPVAAVYGVFALNT